MTAALTLRRFVASPQHIFWLYLMLIALAEFLTAAVSPMFGLALHAALLFILIMHGAFGTNAHQRRLALGLMLAPLIRLLSLTLPLTRLPQAAWYPAVALPLLVATIVLIRQGGVSAQRLGLTPGRLPLELAMGGFGFGLGALEFLILQPVPIIEQFAWVSFLLASLSLLIFTGFAEELWFRGLLQHSALRALGNKAIVYVALLFAILHIGYLSFIDFLFVLAVGLIFGLIVLRTGSILGVTLAHGTTNITLFLLLPHASNSDATQFTNIVWAVILGGTVIGTIAIALALWRGPRQAQAPDAPSKQHATQEQSMLASE